MISFETCIQALLQELLIDTIASIHPNGMHAVVFGPTPSYKRIPNDSKEVDLCEAIW